MLYILNVLMWINCKNIYVKVKKKVCFILFYNKFNFVSSIYYIY